MTLARPLGMRKQASLQANACAEWGGGGGGGGEVIPR